MSKPKQIIRVKDVMKTDFTTIDGTATISEAVKRMKEAHTAVLIINKRHADDEYGLLTSGDIARHVLAKDRSPNRVNVYEIMTCPAIAVSPDMDIRYCSRLFSTYNLVRAPVIENGIILGIVSPNSLVLDGLYQYANDTEA
ncbi:MAG: CBS domain-containing protein [Methylococcales bacterium]|nr:CBS domain-containing protein [Methylococcales bacterium]